MEAYMERYLYFRTVADEDNDDGDTASSGIAPTSIAIPASAIVGMAPSAAGTLTIWFQSARNRIAGATGEEVIKDSVVLNITTKRHKKVMDAIIQSINGGPHSDGWIVVADDMTTNAANATVAAQYLHDDITTCGAINLAAAQA
tara:strand:+ start:122 stop:553 length:432 start_codon:yes stop_codon:yes gene_type:complete